MSALVEALPARSRPGDIIEPVEDTGVLIRAGIALRSGGTALNGLTISETRFIFLSASGSSAVRVRWFLDGVEVGTDDLPPFDFEGAETNGDPKPLRALADGAHTISALFTRGDGTVAHVIADFDVENDPDVPGGPGPGTGNPLRDAIGVHSQGNVNLVQDQLGRQVAYRLAFVGWRGLTWEQWLADVQRALASTAWRSGTWTMVLSVPPTPDPAKVPGISLANGAAGAYNARWQAFTALLNALPADLLDRLVLALFREHNAPWYAGWSTEPKDATQAQKLVLCGQMVGYWQQIVTTIRTGLGTSKSARLKFEWTPNGPPANDPARAALIVASYPGDAYVDIVGMDYYTNLDSLKAGFAAALRWFIDFAASKGKLWAITETATGCYIEMAPGWSFDTGEWSPTKTYTVAATTPVIFTGDRFWRARSANTGVEPGSDPAVWAPTLEHKGPYNPAVVYAKGDIVEANFLDWRCDIDGTFGITPADNAQWSPAFSGPGDYPQWATDLWNGAAYAANRASGSIIHHFMPWEFDVPRERMWASDIAQKRALPGREDWRVGRVDVITTATSPTVTAAGRKDWFDASDVGQLLIATGIPAGAKILSVATDGRTATLSANATSSGTRSADHGGILKPNYLTNYPRTARRFLRLDAAAAA